jgi:asparagine synthase (glutamine-hydrolysing)
MAHRGPDDEGVYLERRPDGEVVGLGHRRLSIIDLSPAGHEPMTDSSGSIVLSFNGEIYNFRDLRRELEGLGHKFKSDTDAEVIIYGYLEWGYESLARLNGMFAFAIWDWRDQSLFLARDRLGIKPLYYCQTPGGFAFASEIKAMLGIPGFARDVNLAALNQFMTFLWTPDPGTMFKGVYKLPPGHYLVYKNAQPEIHQYWDLEFRPDDSLTEGEWVERVRDQIGRSVRAQLVADVPLGAFLSGGLDSSIVVALMSGAADHRVVSYSFGLRDEDQRYEIQEDDLKYARIAGRQFNTDYNEELLDPDVMDLFPGLVYQMDEPIADPAIVTSFLICRSAGRRLKVLLSGMGGDEGFAGYPRHLAQRISEFYKLIPEFVTRPVVQALPGSKPGRFTGLFRNTKKLARSARLPRQDRYLGFGTYFTEAEKPTIYTSELSAAVAGLDPYCEHKKYFNRVADQDFVNQMLYIDLKTFLPSLNLTYTDKTSMASSVEVRVPLLDHDLIELTAKVPPRLKLKGLTRKYLLKRAAAAWLPKEIIDRKKAGFSAPVRAWLVRDLRQMVEELLSESNVRSRGYFQYRSIRRLLDEQLSGKEDNSLKVFQLMTLEVWHRAFIDSNVSADPAAASLQLSL